MGPRRLPRLVVALTAVALVGAGVLGATSSGRSLGDLLAGAAPSWSSPLTARGGGDPTVELPEASVADELPTGRVPTADADEPVVCPLGSACVAWTHELAGLQLPSGAALHGDRVALVAGDRLELLDVGDGSPVWRAAIPADGDGRPVAQTLVVTDGEVLVRTADGRLVAHDAATGEPRWSVPIDADLVEARRLDDVLLVRLRGGAEAGRGAGERLLAVDPRDGDVRWDREGVRVALTDAGPVVFDGPDALVGLDPGDGATRWTQSAGGLPPRVVALGDRLVLLGPTQAVVLHAADGERIAALPGAPVPTIAPGIDVLLIAGTEQLFYLDADGTTWTVPLEDRTGCCRGLQVAQDQVSVLLADGTPRTFERRDGTPVDEPAVAGLVGDDGGVLIGDFLVSVEPEDGDAGVVTLRDARTALPFARIVVPAQPLGFGPAGELLVLTDGRLTAVAPPTRR